MITTQPIPLYESPLLTRLQPQRLELFSQHGRRAIKHARHRFPGALRLLRPFPGHLDDETVVIFPSGSRGKTLPHSTAGEYVQVGALPAPPLPASKNGPPQASCVRVGHPTTPDIPRQGACKKRYRNILAHFSGEPWSTALSTALSNTPTRSRISPRNPGMSWVVETAASVRPHRSRRLARHHPARTL